MGLYKIKQKGIIMKVKDALKITDSFTKTSNIQCTQMKPYTERKEMMGNKSEATQSVVVKWRGIDHYEMVLWAYLRLDRVEEILGIECLAPDLTDISDKL